MQVTYIDEAYSQERDWLFLSSFTLPAADNQNLKETIKDAFNILRWRRMESLKDLRRGETFDVETRNEMSRNLYEHLDEQVEYTVHLVALHQPSLNFDDDSDVYLQAFKYLMERVQHYLRRRDEWGVAYIDTGENAEAVQEAHHQLAERGSEYVNFDSIAGLCAPLDDEYSYGIQMADLVGSACRAFMLDIEWRWFMDYVREHMDRHPRTGEINGTGAKIFPDDARQHLPISD